MGYHVLSIVSERLAYSMDSHIHSLGEPGVAFILFKKIMQGFDTEFLGVADYLGRLVLS